MTLLSTTLLSMTILVLLSTHSLKDDASFRINFGKQSDSPDWLVINDNVMGGLSESSVRQRPDYVHFEGKVSLENNGGFASYQSQYDAFNLSGFKEIRLRVRSQQPIPFSILLKDKQPYYTPNYKGRFTPSKDWEVITIPINKMEAYILGRKVGGAPAKSTLEKIIRIGLITEIKQPVPFELDIDYIEFRV